METTRKIDAKAARRKRRLIREWITYAVIFVTLEYNLYPFIIRALGR